MSLGQGYATPLAEKGSNLSVASVKGWLLPVRYLQILKCLSWMKLQVPLITRQKDSFV